ncbi:HAD-IIB family hydrolase [Candidatus Protochlamydia phocaeensis]|uniref:HAD-IIB family hydrolase n=1 Tax=Candidatus Protochlamydia phocaeensis TaxID=1414722 RepID=UPI00083938A6|nr:HAD family hydrolase [Candidatus Protochlamydia phocaeensis]
MFFRSFKGIIALDIDGTVTAESHALSSAVMHYLNDLHQKGWQILFITGRPFQWGFHSLQALPFAYSLAVQNGALLLNIPSKKVLARKYLTSRVLPIMEAICKEQQTDFVVYSGLENEDYCYYRPEHWPSDLLAYVQKRSAYLAEKWVSVKTFDELPVESFPSVKLFAKEEAAFRLSRQIEQRLDLHVPPNKDPFDPTYFVVQATHPEANKGNALREFLRMTDISGPIIAAGNDYNDFTLLQAADIKIAMADAPKALLDLADIIAPPAIQEGIIKGLKEAIERVPKIKQGKSHD